MFDKLKALFSKKGKSDGLVLPSNADSASTPPAKDSNGVPSLKMTTAPQQTQGMTPEEQKKLLAQRRKIPVYVIVLKFLSLISLTAVLIGWFAVSADLNPENKFLKYFGLEENTEKKHKSLETELKKQKDDLGKIKKKTAEYEKRIENKDFTIYKKQIEALESKQFRWFDEQIKDESGKTKTAIGIIDSIDHMKQYLTKSDYENSKNISFIMNDIDVQTQNFNRKSTNLNVRVSNVSHNSFALSTEFIEMMNSFPFFKGAQITSFARQENKKGEMESKFNIKLSIQEKDEEDPADARYEEYVDWLKKAKTKKESTRSPRRK